MLKIAVGPGTPDTAWTEAVMKAWKKHTWAWDINGVSLALVHGSQRLAAIEQILKVRA